MAQTVSTKVAYVQNGGSGSQTVRTDESHVPASDSLTTPTGSGTAFAQIGTLRVGAYDATTGLANGISSTRTESTASWLDQLTLTTPGAASGIATFVLSLSAISQASLSGIVNSDALVSVNGLKYLEASYTKNFPNVPNGGTVDQRIGGTIVSSAIIGSEITGNYLIYVPFTSGTPFSLFVQTACSASSTPAGGSASCDMTHTARWAGLSSIVDANGAPVAFSAQSRSGYDYVTRLSAESAVPEPAVWICLIMGFGLIGAALRSNRRARPIGNAALAAGV